MFLLEIGDAIQQQFDTNICNMSNLNKHNTETTMPLDISLIYLGGGESPVRLKFGIKRNTRNINQNSKSINKLPINTHSTVTLLPIERFYKLLSECYDKRCAKGTFL